jgi:hypothetical protein
MTKILSQSDKEFQIFILCLKYLLYELCVLWVLMDDTDDMILYELCVLWVLMDDTDDMIMLKICMWGVSSMILGQNISYGSQVFVIPLHLTEESLRSKPLPFKHFLIKHSWIIPLLML